MDDGMEALKGCPEIAFLAGMHGQWADANSQKIP